MTDILGMADETPENDVRTLRLRYELVDGAMRIDIDSRGFEDDPNMIAMYLSFTLDRMLAQAGDQPPV